MSSKFAKSESVNNTPSWCKAPPEVDLDCFPLPPGALPPCVPAYLVAYAKWIDHDPDAYTHLAESFQAPFSPPGFIWTGQSSDQYPRVGCMVRWVGQPSRWQIHLTVWRSADDSETQHWPNVEAESTDPLIIKPPRIENIPLEDYQQIEVYG